MSRSYPPHRRSPRPLPAGPIVVSRSVAPTARRPQQRIVKLQQLAGNQAVCGLLRAPSPPVTGPVLTVQRHSSWEHKMLGDVKPSTLKVITRVNEHTSGKQYSEKKVNLLESEKPEAVHALQQQLDLLSAWQASPPGPGQTSWKGLSLVTVTVEEGQPDLTDDQRKVVCSIGEMNTLADYFGSLDQLRKAKKGTVQGILQQVRQDSFLQLRGVLASIDPGVAAGVKEPPFEGAVTSAEGLAKEASLEAFTSDGRNKATQTYLANANRNACHFAPQSWYRWKDHHEQARKKARQAFDAKEQAKKKDNDSLLAVSKELSNEAIMTNGFGDHYLQDSFAGGHLINKTLVMQWFVAWLASHRDTTLDKVKARLGKAGSLIPEQSAGERWVKDWDKVQEMTPTLQGKLAALHLYDRPPGAIASDPQTVEEQATREARIARTGLEGPTPKAKGDAYEGYLAMLDNALLQLGTKVLHDHFCAAGLVVSANGTPVGRVLGDDNMIKGGEATGYSAETAQKSQKAITDIIEKGSSSDTTEAIMDRFPNEVKLPPDEKETVSLEEWHSGGRLKAFCEAEIFPKVLDEYSVTLGLAPASLGKVSRDVPGGKETSSDLQSKKKWLEDRLEELIELKRRAGQTVEAARAKWEAIKRGGSELWEDIKEGARDLWETVTDEVSERKEALEQKYDELVEEIPQIASEVGEKIDEVREALSEIELPDLPDMPELSSLSEAKEAIGGAVFGDESGGDF